MAAKVCSIWSFLILMVKTQWRDRIQTSAFLIGISLQTGLLAFGIFSQAGSANEALILAIRAAGFTSVGILLLSAMSSIANEFRYGTIENVLVSNISIVRLVGLRALSTGVISSPAILIPFGAAIIKFPTLLNLNVCGVIMALYIFSITLCYQTSYLINAFTQPSIILPSVKSVILLIGFQLLPMEWVKTASNLFPNKWILDMVQDSDLAWAWLGFTLTTLLWTAVFVAGLKILIDKKVDERLVTGKIQ